MKRRQSGLFLALTAVVFFLASVQPLQAALTLTSGSNATTTPSVATSITGFQIVGDAASTTPVKIHVTNGTVSASVVSGVTMSGSGSATINLSGTVTNLNTALSTLAYTRSSTGTDTLEVALVNSDQIYFSDNSHVYQYVSSSLDWNAAKLAAEALTAYGSSGYLVTITSAAENNFVKARLNGDAWIGASDVSSEGDWKWVTGPEAGTSFWSGADNGHTVNSQYASWGGGEPNDSGGSEDCGEEYVSSGTWNDLPCSGTSISGYVAEFGSNASPVIVVSKNVSIVTADVPAVTSLSPANAATSVNTSANLVVGFSKSVTVGTGNITIRKSSDDSLFESIDVTGGKVTGGGSSSITINPSGTLLDSTQYYVLIPSSAFKDSSNNFYDGIAATTTWRFTSGDFTAPVASSLSASSTASTTAQIAWTTNELASSKVSYGPTSSYGTSTAITDTSPRVLSHTVSLSRLLGCTTYHYAVVSADASSNIGTSTDGTFITSGCVASTTPTAATSTSITANAGGSASLTNSNATITVRAPSNFTATTSSVVIQVQAISQADIAGTTGSPVSGVTKVGSIVFDVKAIIDSSTVLDSFNSPVTITYTYTDADIDGLDESSLKLYHYHNSAWSELDSCTVTTSTNTISCTTQSFSIFSLYGQQLSTASAARGRNTSIAVVFGCKDPVASNYNYFSVSKPTMCVYARTDTSTTLPTTAAIFTRDLKKGSTGNDVRTLQQFLNTHGYPVAVSGVGSAGHETTLFGTLTRDALAKFQAAHKIAPTQGYFGQLTRKKIIEFVTTNPIGKQNL